MLELRMAQGSLLKKALEAFKDFARFDAHFDFSDAGFLLQAINSIGVPLVAFLLRSQAFEHYHCDRSISMGVNVGNMAKIFDCAGDHDIVTIRADDGAPDFITFVFKNPIAISVTQEVVKFSTRGDIGIATIICRQNTNVDKPEEATVITMKEPVRLSFGRWYQKAFTEATGMADQVKISLSSDLPSVVEYKVAEMGCMRFYTA
ncbi:hypothetical protein FEM48_Zijuj03G0099800 [Ziziphus jujuba var. spinosa]|uniref:Proliferating cell nuclear antigen PCNA N-terminal domain-containing protein n=1 Tax=Ziziphus jujuba var. spinosa TaxID=714518 RepID=A0A978VPM8_ZIZJJ|nr:hypothetical protein FEM48_Zijuj03G0099800 [Ziziphus jujuba var. spinosa]